MCTQNQGLTMILFKMMKVFIYKQSIKFIGLIGKWRNEMFKSTISLIIILTFTTLGIMPYGNVFAQEELVLPAPGQMVSLTPSFNPLMIKGLKIHQDNPFEFDFVINQGQETLSDYQFKEESLKLVKYFLASLAIPEKDLWVNLSPYEKNRITTPELGSTEMGKDLLSQDYVLKQLTSSLIYPEGETGKKFWARVYALAEEKYHTTNIPINTFNKVWIVPQKATVYENSKTQTAYVLESKLKVMLEEDYLSIQKHTTQTQMPTRGHVPLAESQRAVSPSRLPTSQPLNLKAPQGTNPNEVAAIGSQIIREIVLPELTKEVNTGKNFANLRQITNSLILAAWYKRALKESILGKLYVDQKKMAGVNLNDPTVKERIYQQYLKAYKKGVYNYIKEEIDPISQEVTPRKYFSGGYVYEPNYTTTSNLDPAQLADQNDRAVTVKLDNTINKRFLQLDTAMAIALKKNGLKQISKDDAEQILSKMGAQAFVIKDFGVNLKVAPDDWDKFIQTSSGIYKGIKNTVYFQEISNPEYIDFILTDHRKRTALTQKQAWKILFNEDAKAYQVDNIHGITLLDKRDWHDAILKSAALFKGEGNVVYVQYFSKENFKAEAKPSPVKADNAMHINELPVRLATEKELKSQKTKFQRSQGIINTKNYSLSNSEINQKTSAWFDPVTGKNVADVGVAGAEGVAGIAVRLHLLAYGVKKVIGFGIGKPLKSFSDGLSGGFRTLRTNPQNHASFVIDGLSPKFLLKSLALTDPKVLAPIRHFARKARENAANLLGEKMLGLPPGTDDDIRTNTPVLLGEFYLDGILAEEEAERMGGLFSSDRKITNVEKVVINGQTLYKFTDNKNFEQYQRIPIIAIGQKKEKVAQILKTIAKSYPKDVLLNSDPENLTISKQDKKKVTIYTSQTLNDPLSIEDIKNRDKIVVVGSGLSGANNVIRIAEVLKPGSKIVLITKPIGVHPSQSNPEYRRLSAMHHQLNDEETRQRALRDNENFGTPITPVAKAQLEKLVDQGVLEIITLDNNDPIINENGFSNESGYSIKINVTDNKNTADIYKNGEDGKQSIVLEGADAFVSGIGYRRDEDELLHKMASNGLVNLDADGNPILEHGTRSTIDPHVYFLGLEQLNIVPATSIAGNVFAAIQEALEIVGKRKGHLTEDDLFNNINGLVSGLRDSVDDKNLGKFLLASVNPNQNETTILALIQYLKDHGYADQDIPDIVSAATNLGHQDLDKISDYYRQISLPENNIPESLRGGLLVDSTLGGQNPKSILTAYPNFINYPPELRADAIKASVQPTKNKAIVDGLFDGHFSKYQPKERLKLILASFFPAQNLVTIDQLYQWFKDNNFDQEIIADLVLASIHTGFNQFKVGRLYNRFNAEENNPRLSAFKVRAAVIFFPQYNDESKTHQNEIVLRERISGKGNWNSFVVKELSGRLQRLSEIGQKVTSITFNGIPISLNRFGAVVDKEPYGFVLNQLPQELSFDPNKIFRIVEEKVGVFSINYDKAAISKVDLPFEKGGIDLNTSNLDLEIKRDGKGIPLPVEFQNLENVHINGLSPVIVNVTPIANLSEFLGAINP